MSTCPPYAPFFGFAGVSAAPSKHLNTLSFSPAIGAAFGTAKAGIGIAGLGTFKPELIMKALAHPRSHVWNYRCLRPCRVCPHSRFACVPSKLESALLIFAVVKPTEYPLFAGFVHLGAGVACGVTGIAAGYAIGLVGDSCVRAYVQEQRLFVGMVLILIFAEVLGLYGLIVALIMNTKALEAQC
ncbi:V-type proton ATPase proteolipid subunit [Mycena kentingensis (nom. inval.)]|nr:V-type proton ATPase proteolipid subunit [Mycena kentingensis (nom. inval.)]